MTPGNTFTSRWNRRQAERILPDARSLMANYEKQRRYYFRDEDNTRYLFEEQQFESVFMSSHNSLLK